MKAQSVAMLALIGLLSCDAKPLVRECTEQIIVYTPSFSLQLEECNGVIGAAP